MVNMSKTSTKNSKNIAPKKNPDNNNKDNNNKNSTTPKKNPEMTDLDKRIEKMTLEEIKQLLHLNAYKLALTRAQLEAIVELLIKKKIMTYDEVWKLTNEIFKDQK